MEVMRDPVITADGQTYERAEIGSWFALGNRTNPLTGAELPSTNLLPNIALRNAIRESGLLRSAWWTQGWASSTSSRLLRLPDIYTVRHEIEVALIETNP